MSPPSRSDARHPPREGRVQEGVDQALLVSERERVTPSETTFGSLGQRKPRPLLLAPKAAIPGFLAARLTTSPNIPE